MVISTTQLSNPIIFHRAAHGNLDIALPDEEAAALEQTVEEYRLLQSSFLASSSSNDFMQVSQGELDAKAHFGICIAPAILASSIIRRLATGDL
jgi:hypothetical protein